MRRISFYGAQALRLARELHTLVLLHEQPVTVEDAEAYAGVRWDEAGTVAYALPDKLGDVRLDLIVAPKLCSPATVRRWPLYMALVPFRPCPVCGGEYYDAHLNPGHVHGRSCPLRGERAT